MASSVIVSAIVSCLTALHAAQEGPEGPLQERARLCVALTSQVDRRVLDMRALEAEVNRIWRPYGVRIDGLHGPCAAAADARQARATLEVRLRSVAGGPQPANLPRHVLGSISFVDGVPQPVVDLWADEAMRMMGGDAMSSYRDLADGPSRVELSRLLARSLAHELGHYLLATESHGDAGLMRRHFDAWDARTTDMSLFTLDVHQIGALERTLASWRVVVS